MPVSTLPQPALSTGVTGTGPAFSAYLNTNQTVTSAVFTKIALNAENFDTNSNFDTSLYRFTPTVAGYYQISAGTRAGTSGDMLCAIYKNSALWARGSYVSVSSFNSVASTLVYLNGSTDFVELYGYIAGSTTFLGNQAETWMSGVLVRAA